MYRANMLMAWCLVAAALPWALVEGRKGCWAGPAPGDVCLYGQLFQGSSEMQIRYVFTSRFTRICCYAYQCKFRRNCSFQWVGCGQNANAIPFKSQPLDWELRDVEPIMRCYDDSGRGAYYSYTVEPYASN